MHTYSSKKKKDEEFLKIALKLAKKGEGKTQTNPLVGAIVVKNGKIVGRGYHKKFGAAHGEIEAIKNAGKDAQGSTLYVNLEPCCHYGKTPPCTGEIIKAGIVCVVACTQDPNSQVSGKGFQILKKHGIVVEFGLLEKAAHSLNEVFFHTIKRKTPFVALKIAITLDGKIASSKGDSRWITGKKSRIFVHQLRRKYDACLVGINTVLKDDCHLGVRHVHGRDPLRIIIDPQLKIPENAKALRDKNALIVYEETAFSKSKNDKLRRLGGKGIQLFQQKKIDLPALLRYLYQQLSIASILVEGGSITFTHFFEQNLVDKYYFFIAPKIVGGEIAPSPMQGNGVNLMKNAIKLKKVQYKKLGEDMLISGDRADSSRGLSALSD